jgi:ABC-type glycerol-3-phosphate transport system substrate-binding protein
MSVFQRCPRLAVFLIVLGGVWMVNLGAGCRRAQAGEDNVKVIRVWSHQGQEAENRAMRGIAEAFNAAHAARGVRVEMSFFPDFQYSEKLAIAAAARDLPDAFDLDGPLVARLVDAGLLAPIDVFIGPETRADFLPTILEQGTVGGRLYALGAFDSAVVLYYDRELLAKADVEPEAGGEGWTWEEFMAACARLKAAGIEPVAMHMDDGADEWFTYAFSPVVWSGVGDLIAPGEPRVRGVLASGANVRSLRAWQEVFGKGFAATDPVDPDPFGSGTVAMDWTGHWMARSHLKTKGARLGAMRLPRAGEKSVAPCGSWAWGVSAHVRDPALAALWVKWVTDTETGVVPIVRANGAVPARHSAFAFFPEYERMPYALFRAQLETSARARPRTPFYATLTGRFAAALRDIARGAEVETRLKQAEDEVQSVIDRRVGGKSVGENRP